MERTPYSVPRSLPSRQALIADYARLMGMDFTHQRSTRRRAPSRRVWRQSQHRPLSRYA